MRKTDRNLKRVQFFKRLILITVVVQTLLILWLVAVDYVEERDTVEPHELIYETVTIDRIGRSYTGRGRSRLYLYSDSKKYIYTQYFSKTKDFATHELKDVLCEGDVLSIVSVKGHSFFQGDFYSVFALQDEETVYKKLDLARYNKNLKELRFFWIVLISILECLFLAGVVYAFVSNNQELKFFVRKKKKRKKPATDQSDKKNDG